MKGTTRETKVLRRKTFITVITLNQSRPNAVREGTLVGIICAKNGIPANDANHSFDEANLRKGMHPWEALGSHEGGGHNA